jgi:O-antigen/teichoic acid export membrane protein
MTQGNPKRALMAGAAWAVAMRWSVRALGFCNTLIMARLVMPADYGVVAMSMLVVGLVQTLLDTGTVMALLRKGELAPDEIDSAWTLRLLEFLGVALLIALAAYPATLYFNESRVFGALLILSACIAFQAFASVGHTLAVKELNFSAEFRLAVVCKFIGVISTILGGLFFGDYRALILGIASGYVSSTLMSYTVHPYRARWNTSRILEIWHVTKWLMFSSAANFVLRKGDELIASKLGGSQQFGLYNVGSDLGQMPTGEVGPALLKSFLPVLSTIQDDTLRTNQAVLKTIGAVNTLTMPIGIGFAALAVPFTDLLLGAKWAAAAPFVAVFAIVSIVQIALSPLTTLLILRGETKRQSMVVWIEFLFFCIASAAFVPHFGLVGLAYARIIGSLANAMQSAANTRRCCGIQFRDLVGALIRPLIGSVLLGLLMNQVAAMGLPPLGHVLVGAVSGGVFYSTLLYASWWVVGCPEGLESTIFDKLRVMIKRKT